MDLLIMHNIIGVFATIISLSLGLLMFPVQIIKIKENKGSTKELSVAMGLLPFITYTLWWMYGATFPDGMDYFMVVANSPGVINSFRFLRLFYLDDRKLFTETKNEIVGLIKIVVKQLRGNHKYGKKGRLLTAF